MSLIAFRFSLGIDPVLAQHVAHLFIRDTITLFKEKLDLDDTKDADHFEVRKNMILFEIKLKLFYSKEYQFNQLAINAF